MMTRASPAKDTQRSISHQAVAVAGLTADGVMRGASEDRCNSAHSIQFVLFPTKRPVSAPPPRPNSTGPTLPCRRLRPSTCPTTPVCLLQSVTPAHRPDPADSPPPPPRRAVLRSFPPPAPPHQLHRAHLTSDGAVVPRLGGVDARVLLGALLVSHRLHPVGRIIHLRDNTRRQPDSHHESMNDGFVKHCVSDKSTGTASLSTDLQETQCVQTTTNHRPPPLHPKRNWCSNMTPTQFCEANPAGEMHSSR